MTSPIYCDERWPGSNAGGDIAVLDDDGELIGIRRVVRVTIRNRGSGNQAVSVLVLQSFTGQSRPPGGAADQEAPRLHVASRPYEIANALEAEHRVVNVERHHRDIVIGIRGASRDP